MTAREWQPGDVAMVRLDPETEIRVMYNGANWVGRKGAFYDLHASARPLVVIDPEDREQIVRLLRGYGGWVNAPDGDGIEDHPRYVANMQAALREFANPTPVKPDEPTGLGAVVEDADGVLWVRNPDAGVICKWRDATRRWRTYSAIAAVRVLSEGVTA